MTEIRKAGKADKENILTLMGEYHLYESIDSTYQHRQKALAPLLSSNSSVGFVLVATSKKQVIGYIAICFSYSIECGGHEAFIDEFYLVESMRNQGTGSKLLACAKEHIKKNSIYTLHLEVAIHNHNAKIFYKKQGFYSRELFHLMSCNL